MSGMERGRILIRAANLIRDNLEEFARAETLDNGKTLEACKLHFSVPEGSLVGEFTQPPAG